MEEQNQTTIIPPNNEVREHHVMKWVVVAVLVVIILGASYYIYKHISSNRAIINKGLPAGYVTAPVAEMTYPKGLPIELILYPSVPPVRGEVTTPVGGATQIITVFVVHDSPSVVFNKYITLLEKNSWSKEIENSQNNLYYAKYSKSKDTLDVTVSKTAQGTQVQLNYVAEK